MFSKEQVETLYLLVEKGIRTAEEVNEFLSKKLDEIGLTKTPPPAPEQPAEPTPPAPEAAPAEGQPTA